MGSCREIADRLHELRGTHKILGGIRRRLQELKSVAIRDHSEEEPVTQSVVPWSQWFSTHEVENARTAEPMMMDGDAHDFRLSYIVRHLHISAERLENAALAESYKVALNPSDERRKRLNIQKRAFSLGMT